jgi:tRNA threonylcarbamoyladenosine biosynthesis protein TsaB
MNILAVDTALSACSLAIRADGRTVTRSQAMQRGHAEALMPMLAEAMAEAGIGYDDIDRFVVTIGPGTFTGVRVGVAAIRGLALSTGREAVGVTTLEALAATARMREGGTVPLLIAMDARREEIYAQAFAADGAPTSEPMVAGIDTVLKSVPAGVETVFGSAATMVADAVGQEKRRLRVLGTDAAPDPLALLDLGSRKAADMPPKPYYLRRPDAKPQDGAAIARK